MALSKKQISDFEAVNTPWHIMEIEHGDVAGFLNGLLEKSKYEVFQLIDGQIWMKVILRKKAQTKKENTHAAKTEAVPNAN